MSVTNDEPSVGRDRAATPDGAGHPSGAEQHPTVQAPVGPDPPAHNAEVPVRVIRALWLALGALFLALILIGATLLMRMEFLSSEALSDVQLKTLWAFLGVALGAVATLIGALLTDQHNRRTSTLARESAHRQALERDREHTLAVESAHRLQLEKEREHTLNAHAERRLALETVAKLLDLLTTEKGEYAPKARVGGAIATMMELHGSAVAIQVLGDLWAADKVDTGTAVWIIDRTLASDDLSRADAEDASYLLTRNACKLFPADGDRDQDWSEWPAILRDEWPAGLPLMAQHNLLMTAVYALLGRGLDYWKQLAGVPPLRSLYLALDGERLLAWHAAQVLMHLSDLGVLRGLWASPPEFDEERVRALADGCVPAAWWIHLLEQFDGWAHGQEPPNFVHPEGTGAVTASAQDSLALAAAPADGQRISRT